MGLQSYTIQKLWRWFFPKGAQARDLVLPILTVLVLGAVTLSSVFLYRQQEYDGEIIDMAGKQRMLLQAYYREAVKTDPSPEALQKLLGQLLDTAHILRYGGYAASRSKVDQWILIQPLDQVDSQKLQEEQIRGLQKLVGQGRISEGDAPAKVLDQALAQANEIVGLYIKEAQTHLRQLLVTMVGLALFLGILGLVLSRMMFERRNQMALVSKAMNQAVNASQAKTQFLANMSHEIRTPLNAIIGMTEILHETVLTADQLRFVKTLRRAGDTLLALINDILDLSKIESGQIELNERELDVVDLIDRLTEMVALRAHQKGLELNTFIASGVPAKVISDELRIRQVLTNLLGNAVKFTSSGEINLKLEVDPSSKSDPTDRLLLRFTVSDTGIGIPENRQQSIFENFAQADSTISTEYGGTGLGLAICNRLTQLMKGQLSVRSQAGAGSTFSFVVPVLESRESSSLAKKVQNCTNKRVLLIDDNDTNRFIVRSYLSEVTNRVDEASSGTAALDMLKRTKAEGESYDVVLLDYRMPGLNGVETAARIQREGLADGTILMLLTSDGVRSDVAKLSEIGISEFMVKPIRKREFLETISKIFADSKEPETSQADKPSSFTPNGEGRRVLLVDDVEDNRLVASTFLKNMHFQVDEASGGAEAIRLCFKRPYDLIFMDIRMSPMDGYETTRKIREWEKQNSKSRIPIVALSAQALKEEIDQAILAGCDGHITKPIKASKLSKAVCDFLNLKTTAAPIIPKLDEFMKARLPAYLDQLKQDLSSWPNVLSERDLSQLERMGHNISGTAGMYELNELASLARDLEVCAKKGDLVRSAELRQTMLGMISRVQVGN